MKQPTYSFIDDFADDLDPGTLDDPHPGPRQPNFHFTSYITGLLTALVLVGGMNLLLQRSDPPPIVLQPPPPPAPTATPFPTNTPAPIVVFVSGAVQQPGMYSLAAEARVGDALTAAGGMTLQANAPVVNQAERLWDGAQIHVPLVSAATTTTSSTVEAPTEKNDEQVAVVTIAEPPVGLSGSMVSPEGRSNLGGENSGGLININRAAPSELEALPGIGPSKAAAIVVNRPYNSIDDLAKVPGIGAKTIEQLRPLVATE